MNAADWIRHKRTDMGMSREAAAAAVGAAPAEWRQIEAGERVPGTVMCHRIDQLFRWEAGSTRRLYETGAVPEPAPRTVAAPRSVPQQPSAPVLDPADALHRLAGELARFAGEVAKLADQLRREAA